MSEVRNSAVLSREATSHGTSATPMPSTIHAATRAPAGAGRASIARRQYAATITARAGKAGNAEYSSRDALAVKNASTHTDQASGSARPLLRSGEATAAGRKSDHEIGRASCRERV